MKYSAEFREAAVRKLLAPDCDGLKPLARRLGVLPQTLRHWKNAILGGTTMKQNKTSGSWSAEQKLQSIMATSSLSEIECGEYCRRHGLHAEQLKEWRDQCLSSMRRGPKPDPEKKELKKQNKALAHELRRKEKALAEAAALLILKKKMEIFWNTDEECEEN